MFGGGNSDKDNESSGTGLDSWVDNSFQDISQSLQEAREWSNRTLDRLNRFMSPENFPAALGGPSSGWGLPRGAWNSLGSRYQAYPVPSIKQYTECVDNTGKSVWTEDGVWRCLFKDSPAYADMPSQSQQFTDYTGFLEWQRRLVKQRQEEQHVRNERGPLDVFPGSNRPRLISQEDAKGKKLVSSDIRSETVTLDDGSLETRRQEIRYYDDNTATLSKTSSKGAESSSKGWFWK